MSNYVIIAEVVEGHYIPCKLKEWFKQGMTQGAIVASKDGKRYLRSK